MGKYPYRKAVLVHWNYDLTKRWFVEYYAWDINKDKKVRVKAYEPLNREKNINRRLYIAERMIQQINHDLERGKVLGGGKKVADSIQKTVTKLSLLQAVEYVKDHKKSTNHSKHYVSSFDRLKSNLEKWFESTGKKDFPARMFSSDNAHSFFNYLINERKVANKTYNNYRTDLATVFNFLMKRNPELFDENPAVLIDKLPVTNRKHAALSDKQMASIMAKCKEMGYHSLSTFIQIIYHTFGRPREVVQLKIENFDLAQNRVLFPASISKNRMDDYVGLSPALRALLAKLNLHQYPGNYYLFGINDKPGDKHMGYLYFYNRNVKVFKALGLDKASVRYSMYSYKHSGVISLYKATKDIKLVQSQCRHHNSLDQTNKYLRDLGLLSDYDGLNAWTPAW